MSVIPVIALINISCFGYFVIITSCCFTYIIFILNNIYLVHFFSNTDFLSLFLSFNTEYLKKFLCIENILTGVKQRKKIKVKKTTKRIKILFYKGLNNMTIAAGVINPLTVFCIIVSNLKQPSNLFSP